MISEDKPFFAFRPFANATTYMDGVGLAKDNIEALKWFSLAVASFDRIDPLHHDDALRKSNQLSKLMTPEQIMTAKKLQQEWLQAHARK